MTQPQHIIGGRVLSSPIDSRLPSTPVSHPFSLPSIVALCIPDCVHFKKTRCRSETDVFVVTRGTLFVSFNILSYVLYSLCQINCPSFVVGWFCRRCRPDCLRVDLTARECQQYRGMVSRDCHVNVYRSKEVTERLLAERSFASYIRRSQSEWRRSAKIIRVNCSSARIAARRFASFVKWFISVAIVKVKRRSVRKRDG